MKIFKNLTILAIALTVLAIGCKTKKDTVPQPSYKQATQKKAYEKRWTVTSSQRISQSTATTTIIAVEFTYNSYLIYLSGDSIVTGTYTQISANTLQLDNYGTLTINSISDSNFGFTLTSVYGNTTITSAAATAVIADSPNTNAICNTWKLTKATFSDTLDLLQPGEELYVTFSRYGTYLTKDILGDSVDYGTNTWLWTNSTEDKFCYGEWNGSNISDCNGLYNVSVIFSDQYSKMKITESVNDTTLGFSYTATYEMEVQ
jgi:hypothetical protein